MQITFPQSLILWVLLLLLLPVNVFAVQASQLDQFVTNTQSFKAEFTQVLADARGEIIEESKGVIKLAKPSKFSLFYSEPSEQQYVSDGQSLWMFDADLEQVTIKPVDDGLSGTPAVLLSSVTELKAIYNIEHFSGSDNREWFELTHKEGGSGFERIQLVFVNGKLSELKMFDGFNQITVLTFNNSETNPGFSDSEFFFKVPEGVDVIGSP